MFHVWLCLRSSPHLCQSRWSRQRNLPDLLTRCHLCCSPAGWRVGSGSDKCNCSLTGRERERDRAHCKQHAMMFVLKKNSVWLFKGRSPVCLILRWDRKNLSQTMKTNIPRKCLVKHEALQSFLQMKTGSVIKFLMNGKITWASCSLVALRGVDCITAL